MGPFGEAVPLTHTGVNNLILLDTVGNLKLIVAMVDKIDKDPIGDTFKKKLEYVRARDAERILKELLGDPLKAATPEAVTPLPGGRGGRGPGGGGPGGFDPNGGGGDRSQDPRFAGGRGGAGLLPTAAAKRMHYISIDESINTIMVTGPADKVALAKKTIEGLDKPDPDNPNQQKIPQGPPILKEYYIDNGNAAVKAKALQERYKDSGSVNIQAAGNSTLIVYAYPSDQIEIGAVLLRGNDSKPKTEMIDCGTQDCTKVATQLQAMFGTQDKSNLFVGSDSERNYVILRGPAELVLQAKQIVTATTSAASVWTLATSESSRCPTAAVARRWLT